MSLICIVFCLYLLQPQLVRLQFAAEQSECIYSHFSPHCTIVLRRPFRYHPTPHETCPNQLAEVVAGVVVGIIFFHIGDWVYCRALMREGVFALC